jgi:predicted nucleic acid-binding protein
MAAPVACDTSFLFALYGRDAHTPRALAAVKRLAQPLTITLFNEYELANAVQFAVFRCLLTAHDAKVILAAFDTDALAGKVILDRCNLADVVVQAKKLSLAHTAAAGHRSFDILQVAAAICLSAKIFLSFDDRQRALARGVGLQVAPS